jgi:hypothetical protein
MNTNEHESAQMQQAGITSWPMSERSLFGELEQKWKRRSKRLFLFVFIRVHSWLN